MKERILETIGLIGLILLLTIAYSIGYSQSTIKLESKKTYFDKNFYIQSDENGSHMVELKIQILEFKEKPGEYYLVGLDLENKKERKGEFILRCSAMFTLDNCTHSVVLFYIDDKEKEITQGYAILNENVVVVQWVNKTFVYLE